jgi:UDP-2,4-diacetamido-2,4,6-trideoxy-beta-L-altropyranose hydrolase
MPRLAGDRLLLRADADERMGSGHLMRLLALGQAWQDAGGLVTVATSAPGIILDRIVAEGWDLHRLAEIRPDGADLAEVRRVAHDSTAMWIAIDGPHFAASYVADLGQAARTLVVDDLAQLSAYPATLVLNQNLHASALSYPLGPGSRLLTGPSYALLRREYRRDWPPLATPDVARRLVVTFGGADPRRLTRRALEALSRSARDAFHVTAVVGGANPDHSALLALAGERPGRIELRHNVSDMAGLLARADLALSSGGSTVWELARMGVPSLIVETATAEPMLAGGLAATGLFRSLGPAERLTDDAIVEALLDAAADRAWRSRMTQMGPTIVDGRGAERVVSAMAGFA